LGPFIPFINISGNFSYIDIILLFCFFYVAFNKKLKFSSISFVPVFLGLVAIASYIINNNNINYIIPTGQIIRWFFASLIIIIYSSFINSSTKIYYCLIGVLLGSFITLLWAWYIWLISPNYVFEIPMLHVIERTNYIINRNYVGFFIAVGTSLSFGFVKTNNNSIKYKILTIIIFCIFVMSLILTYSKGAILSGLFPIFIVSFLSKYNHKRKQSVIVIFSLLLFTYLLLPSDFLFKVNQVIQMRSDQSSYTNEIRGNYVIDAIKIMVDNPFFGTGPKSYKLASIKYGFSPTIDPHNAFLWIGAELGIFSFFALILVLIKYFKFFNSKIIKKSMPDIYLMLFLVSVTIFVHTMVSGLAVSMKITWIFLGIISSIKIKTHYSPFQA
jgi:O-antigen ligase